jgi:hypothetical protein
VIRFQCLDADEFVGPGGIVEVNATEILIVQGITDADLVWGEDFRAIYETRLTKCLQAHTHHKHL